MSAFKGLWPYLRENFSGAKESWEKMSGYISAGIAAMLMLLQWFRIPAPKLQEFLNSGVADLVTTVTFVYGALVLLVWIPFKRHQSEANTHRLAVSDLEGRIAVFEERERPKLAVSCHKSISACSVTNAPGTLHYFRAQVMLLCHQPVTGCHGVLICIQRALDCAIIRDHENEKLPFKPSEAIDSANKTLSPGIPSQLDVVGIAIKEGAVFIPNPGGGGFAPKTKDGELAFKDNAKYYISIKLTGTGIPTQDCVFLFDWTGDHKTSSLTLV